MKHSAFITTLSLLLVVFLITSCSNYDPFKPVASRKALLDSMYGKDSAMINIFFKKIDFVPGIPGFSSSLIILDSSNDLDKIKAVELEEEAISCNDSFGFTADNFILVNNRSNLLDWQFSDTSIRHSTLPYYITQFPYDSTMPEGYKLQPIDHRADFWVYHTYHGFDGGYGDSISAGEKERCIANAKTKLRSLDSLKYIVVVKDVMVKMPILISSKVFESGELITSIRLYDVNSQKLLCRNLMYTKNSDSVSHLFVGVGDDMLKEVLPTRLMEDFCHQKNKKLLQLFNVKE